MMDSCILIRYNNRVIRINIDYNNRFISSDNTLSGTVVKCNKLIACLSINGQYKTFVYMPLNQIYDYVPGSQYNGHRIINVYTVGGLGNHLWIYAFALYIANNIDNSFNTICYNIEWFKRITSDVPREFHLEKFNLDNRVKMSDTVQNYITLNNTVLESKIDYNDILLSNNTDIALSGYWQRWDFIKDNLPSIRKCFTLKEAITDDIFLQYKNDIESQLSCSIHVRRTDYLNKQNFYTILDIDYYIKCIECIKQVYPNIKFYCFSDDIKWCKQAFKHIDNIVYIENVKNDIHEFELMKLCHNNIIANSTFSWWAAILNSNPDKIVIAPRSWYTFNNETLQFGCDGRCLLI